LAGEKEVEQVVAVAEDAVVGEQERGGRAGSSGPTARTTATPPSPLAEVGGHARRCPLAVRGTVDGSTLCWTAFIPPFARRGEPALRRVRRVRLRSSGGAQSHDPRWADAARRQAQSLVLPRSVAPADRSTFSENSTSSSVYCLATDSLLHMRPTKKKCSNSHAQILSQKNASLAYE
jgi:hypothetical protein